jgi:hypothetical protein
LLLPGLHKLLQKALEVAKNRSKKRMAKARKDRGAQNENSLMFGSDTGGEGGEGKDRKERPASPASAAIKARQKQLDAMKKAGYEQWNEATPPPPPIGQHPDHIKIYHEMEAREAAAMLVQKVSGLQVQPVQTVL